MLDLAKDKLSLEFPDMDKLIKRLKQLEVNSKPVAESALRVSHKIVTDAARAAMNKHYRTGETLSTLRSTPVIEWTGDSAIARVGFDIDNGTGKGMPSVYLMYGTPRQEKDQALYDAFYGRKIINEVKKTQKKRFEAAVKRAMGG